MNRRKDSKGRVLKEGESQRKDGTYMFRYTDPSKKRKCVYAKTLNELRQKENNINKNIVLGTYTNDYTLNDAFDRFLEIKTEKEIKPRTKHKYFIEYNRWVRGTWLGKKKLKDLTQSDIKFFYKQKSEESNLSNGTIRIIHKYINGALETAYEDDFIRKNYACHCVKPYLESTPKRALTKDQTDKFLTECEKTKSGKKYMLGLKLMLLSGLRIGEMSGLTWDDVDIKNQTIDINHQFVLGDGGTRGTPHIDKPKTKYGKRKVPISDDCLKLFGEIKRESYFESYSSQVEIDGYSGFVIHTRNGTPVRGSCFNNYAKKIVENYNKTHDDKLPNITCHICRHTFCTRMAELNINPIALKDIMGHGDYKITEDVYITVEDDFVKEEFFQALRGRKVV